MLPTASKGRAPSATRQPNPVFQYLRRIVKSSPHGFNFGILRCVRPQFWTWCFCSNFSIVVPFLIDGPASGYFLLYAFDVHCNAFFPMFVLLYVVHYFFSPLLVAHGFIPELLSNLLFMVAASYYHYLNLLGYDVLPFLERTTFFLYPIGLLILSDNEKIVLAMQANAYLGMAFSSRDVHSR
ncbi:unc-50-like protein [Drosera capensis]